MFEDENRRSILGCKNGYLCLIGLINKKNCENMEPFSLLLEIE